MSVDLLARLDPGPLVVERLLAVLVQTTVVIGLAAVLAGTGLRRRAAARHGLWLGTLVWVLVSPFVVVIAEHAGTIKVLHTLRPFAVAMAGAGEFDPFKD